jgi:hypothetical protein
LAALRRRVLAGARLLLPSSRHSAGQPIITGWAFQWITQLSFDRDSWTAPVDARRLHPLDDTDQTAAAQIRALLARLPAGGPVPWFVFDGGDDSAQLTLDLAEVPVAVLVRLRSDRCFYADPPPRPSGATGRPRRHGAKFAFADPATWPAPTATLHTSDDQYGTVTVTCWAGLHPKQQRHPGHGSRGPRPIVGGTIICVQVERVPARTRPPKVLWLWWAGPGTLDLDLAWRAYIHRFDLEHSVRFAKQTLGWTTPRPRTPDRPTAGPGWCWLHTPSCAWPARSPATNGCRGSGPDPSRDCPPTGSAAGFRDFWPHSARRPPRQNLQAAPQAGPRAADPGPPRGIRPSRSPPPSPGRRPPAQPRPPDRAATSTHDRRRGQRPVRHAAGLNHKLRARASRRSWATVWAAVPAVVGPGAADQAATDDGGAGQCQPELDHQPAPLGAPAQLAVLVAPGMGAFDHPPATDLDRSWPPAGGDLAHMPRVVRTCRRGW